MNSNYQYRRCLHWGDTDAAGIVYTANYFDLCMEALEGWFISVLETDWFSMNVDQKIGTPFVHAEVDFKAPMTPRDTLLIEVTVDRLGEKSLGFELTGYSEVNKAITFSGKFVCCFTNTGSFQPISIPQEMRMRIEGHQRSSTPSGGAY